MKANVIILALKTLRAEHKNHHNLGRKILALHCSFTDFPNPALMEQGIQFSLMLIYIANMPADCSPHRSEGLWERGLMKFRLQIFISNTWPQFLLFLFSKPTRDIIYWGRATKNWSLFLNLITHLNFCFLHLLLWIPPNQFTEKSSSH